MREVREAVPEQIERAVHRALARTPADRFATAEQFAAALEPEATAAAPSRASAETVRTSAAPPSVRRPRAAALTLALGFLIGLGVLFAWRRGQSRAEVTGSRLIAVIPFENVGDTTDEYFADGVTDAVRGKLSAIPGLEVIAGASSSEYKKSAKPLPQIARELGVGYLVVAKIRWAKAANGVSRVQVSPELVQFPPDGKPTTRWQEPFDAAMTDVFQVQADIAGRVVQSLGVALADSTRRQLAQRPTTDLVAYDRFLKAEAASIGAARTFPAALREGIALYQEAVARDPNFALAWARMSSALVSLYSNGGPSRDLAQRAEAAANRALTLDPGLAEGYLARGAYYRVIIGDNARGLQDYSQVRRLAPQNAQMMAALAAVQGELGRYDSALHYLDLAARLDPRSPTLWPATRPGAEPVAAIRRGRFGAGSRTRAVAGQPERDPGPSAGLGRQGGPGGRPQDHPPGGGGDSSERAGDLPRDLQRFLLGADARAAGLGTRGAAGGLRRRCRQLGTRHRADLRRP